jgi:DNA-directed RNA polymerase subunit omega
MGIDDKQSDEREASGPKDLEELLEKVDNRYVLVMAAAQRAKQLSQGASPLLKSKFKKPTSIALEEILKSKIKVIYEQKEGREGKDEE